MFRVDELLYLSGNPLGGTYADHVRPFPGGWDSTGRALDQFPELFSETELAWTEYLTRVNDGVLARELTWKTTDGKQFWRWPIENILYQVSCHAWYHRGQIVELVRQLGGKTESTDYIFWSRPEVVPDPGIEK